MVVRVIGGRKKAIARAKLRAATKRQSFSLESSGGKTYAVVGGKRTFVGQSSSNTQTRGQSNSVTQTDSQQAAQEFDKARSTQQQAEAVAAKYGSTAVQAKVAQTKAKTVIEIDRDTGQSRAYVEQPTQSIQTKSEPISFGTGVKQALKQKYGISIRDQAKPITTKSLFGTPSSVAYKQTYGRYIDVDRAKASKAAFQLAGTYGVARVATRAIAVAPPPVKVAGVAALGAVFVYDIGVTGYEIYKAPPAERGGVFGYQLTAKAPYYAAFGLGAKAAGSKLRTQIAEGAKFEVFESTQVGKIRRGGIKGEVIKEDVKITYELPSEFKNIKETLPTRVSRTVEPGVSYEVLPGGKVQFLEPKLRTPTTVTDVYTRTATPSEAYGIKSYNPFQRFKGTEKITQVSKQEFSELTPFKPTKSFDLIGFETESSFKFKKGTRIGKDFVVRPYTEKSALVYDIKTGKEFLFPRKGKRKVQIEITEKGDVYGGVFGVGLETAPLRFGKTRTRPTETGLEFGRPVTELPFKAAFSEFKAPGSKTGTFPLVGFGKASGVKTGLETGSLVGKASGVETVSSFATETGAKQRFDTKFKTKTKTKTQTLTENPFQSVTETRPKFRGVGIPSFGKKPFYGSKRSLFKFKPRFKTFASPTAVLFNIKASKRQRKKKQFTGLEIIGLR